MEKATTLWESVNTEKETLPKIIFEFNIPVTVQFGPDFVKPEEYPSQYAEEGQEKNYCVFSVIHETERSAIVTSAYSLLRGLKKLQPLANKKVTITKKMEKGKQQYVVEEA